MKQLFYLITILGSIGLLNAQIQSQQIGSASNAYSTYASGLHSISFLPGIGLGNNGSMSFVHRENTALYTGGSSGNFRYAVSTDNGATWTSERGPINPVRTRLARYPQGLLINPLVSGNDTSDLKLALLAPTLTTTGTGFQGHMVGLIDSAATVDWTVTQEAYLYNSGTGIRSRIPRSLVERVPGEYWYVVFENNVRSIGVYKGTYDSTNQRINWAAPVVLAPSYAVGAQQPQGLQIAFSPDGNTGYIAAVGDLAQGNSGIYAPFFIKTTDGGATWSAAEEVNMQRWPRLTDSLRQNGGSGVATLGSDYPPGSNVIPNVTDLTVDSAGNPHFIALVGNRPTGQNYEMDDSKYMIIDVTVDSVGDYEAIFVASKDTRRAIIGNPAVISGNLTLETWMQVTRTADGSKVFYSWTETDITRPGYNPLDDNNRPDLWGRAYDVASGQLTSGRNFSGGDPVWDGAVFTPTVSPVVISRLGRYTVPTVAMQLDSPTVSLLQPVRYHYFSNIQYADTQFTLSPVRFQYTCKTYAQQVNIVPSEFCGNATGFLKVDVTQNLNIGYSTSWSTGATGDSVGGLTPGVYTVIVTDDSMCVSDTLNTNLFSFPQPQFDSAIIQEPSCFGQADGSAQLFISGSPAPYSFRWDNGDTTGNVSNLPAGTYNIAVTDSNGCVDSITLTIDEPPALGVQVSEDPVLCAGQATGGATAAGNGGTPGYTYAWDNGQTGAQLQNVTAGPYNVTVTDSNGCTAQAPVTVTEPLPITLSPTVFGVSCPGGINGRVNLAISGGNGPYQTRWSTGVTTTDLVNVPAGPYTAVVTDANGCIDSITAEVTSPDPIAFNDSVSSVSCDGDTDGSILVLPTGGTMPYTYSWSTGSSAPSLSNLAPGVYTLTLTDANNCVKTEAFQVQEPTALRVRTQATPDNGTGNGTVTATVNGGTPPYTYNWNGAGTAPTLTGLFAGNYIITITDANGCVEADTIVVESNVSVDPRQLGFSVLTVSPNPSRGQFTLRAESATPRSLSLEIFDAQGRRVWRRAVASTAWLDLPIDLQRQAPGIYVLWIQTESGRAAIRLQKW